MQRIGTWCAPSSHSKSCDLNIANNTQTTVLFLNQRLEPAVPCLELLDHRWPSLIHLVSFDCGEGVHVLIVFVRLLNHLLRLSLLRPLVIICPGRMESNSFFSVAQSKVSIHISVSFLLSPNISGTSKRRSPHPYKLYGIQLM